MNLGHNIIQLSLCLAAFLISTTVCWGEEKVDFGRDIQPILSDRCYACHGQDAETREADLRLDRREAAVADGAAIVPGDVNASLLVERILSDDEDEVMPPAKTRKPLSDAQKALLIRWIEEGAEYANHWSFEPIGKPGLPTVAEEDRVRTPLDQFVLGGLAERKIEPAAEAGRAMYLRRVTFDLTGLPPTPEERQAFLKDESPEA